MFSNTLIEPFIFHSETRNEKRQVFWWTFIKQHTSAAVLLIITYLNPLCLTIKLPGECVGCSLRISTGAGQHHWTTGVSSYFCCLLHTWKNTACKRESLLKVYKRALLEYIVRGKKKAEKTLQVLMSSSLLGLLDI